MLSIPRSVSSLRICAWVSLSLRNETPSRCAVPWITSSCRVGRIPQVLLDGAVDLAELLLDRRMAGGIHAGQAPEADEALEQRQRIGVGDSCGSAYGWLTSQVLLLKEDVGAAADARERRAPDPVAERHERRENRLETLSAALCGALEQSRRDLRAAQDEIPLRQQLQDLTSRLGGRKVPQRFGGGAGQPRVCLVDGVPHAERRRAACRSAPGCGALRGRSVRRCSGAGVAIGAS